MFDYVMESESVTLIMGDILHWKRSKVRVAVFVNVWSEMV